jgi:tRNA (guanine9-N1)-methyltransferase
MANSILSKRQERREKRKVIWEEKKSLKKLKKKAKAKNINNVPELDMSEDAVLKRRERQIGRRELFQMAAEEGLKIVIDCGFEDQMSEKEKKSLSQQIMYAIIAFCTRYV